MIVCVALSAEGTADQGWGRADRVAVADVVDGEIRSWQEHAVGWGAARAEGDSGGHHARIVRFLGEHSVDAVVADHMGAGMQRTVAKLGVSLHLGASGDPRAAALAAAT